MAASPRPRSIDAAGLWRHLVPPTPLGDPNAEARWDDLISFVAAYPPDLWSDGGQPRPHLATWFALASHDRTQRPKEMH